MTTATASPNSSPAEFAPGLAIQGFTAPLPLSQFKLIAFDMDSTLISIECIDEIADAVGRKAEVTVSDQEMTQAVLNAARQYPGQERAYFEFVQKNQQVQQQLRAPLFEDKVVDHIVAGAKVKDKDITKAALQKLVEALDEM